MALRSMGVKVLEAIVCVMNSQWRFCFMNDIVGVYCTELDRNEEEMLEELIALFLKHSYSCLW